MDREDAITQTGEGPPGQSDEDSSRHWQKSIAGFLVLLILYPLSLGPVVYLDIRGLAPRTTGSAIDSVYAPLVGYSLTGGSISQSYRRYLDWWLRKGIERNLHDVRQL